MIRSLFLLSVSLLLLRCAEEQPVDSVEEAPTGNAAIIRNPVADATGTSAEDAAAMEFEEEEYDFGEVAAGAVIKHAFAFTNTGSVPLLITDARSTCGCTVAAYPREPVGPGEQAEIEVVFNTNQKRGRQRKPVTLTANTYPASTTLYVAGTVRNE